MRLFISDNDTDAGNYWDKCEKERWKRLFQRFLLKISFHLLIEVKRRGSFKWCSENGFKKQGK